MNRPALMVSLALDLDELETVYAMMARVGAATPASVLKTALWKFAQHLDVPMTSDAFGSWRSPVEKSIRRQGRKGV